MGSVMIGYWDKERNDKMMNMLQDKIICEQGITAWNTRLSELLQHYPPTKQKKHYAIWSVKE